MNTDTIALLDKYFDLAVNAPDGIKRLRETILTLAMQGKLVPQDLKDQPASELLKDIEAEKKRLVTEGKIKEPKPLPPIKPEEVPYQIPKGWEWVRIRDIGHDWGQKEPQSDFTYIDVGSINNSIGKVYSPQVLSSKVAPSRARKVVRKGTVIYSTVRPYLLNIAVIENDYSPEPIASTAFAINHPYDGISNWYIYHYLHSQSFIKYVESAMKGVAYPAINDGDFFQALFPLPPLAEQRRIVAKIDELMARVDELELKRDARNERRLAMHQAAIARLLDMRDANASRSGRDFIFAHFGELYGTKENVAELRKAILQLAVMGRLLPQDPKDQSASELLKEIEAEKKRLVKEGKIKEPKPIPPIKPEEEPYEVPEGWEWVCLEQIGEINPRNNADDIADAGFVPMPLIFAEIGKPHTFEVRKWGDIKKGFTHFKNGDIGMAKITPCFENGKSCIFSDLPNGIGAGTTELHIFRNTFSVIEPRYLLHFIKNPRYLQMGEKKMTGSAGQKRVPTEFFSRSPFPLPPLAEQRRIVAKVDEMMALCDKLDKQIDERTAKESALLEAVAARV